jgi:tetratricopeptide (TPR) repeat protein
MLDHLREAERLAAVLDDQRRLGEVYGWMALYLWWTGDPEHALMHGQRALTMAQVIGDAAFQGWAAYLLGIVYYTEGSYRQALEYFSRTMAVFDGDRLYERLGFMMFSVFCRSRLSMLLAEWGALPRGESTAHKGAALPRQSITSTVGV